MMKVAVFGLGYVGAVTAAMMAERGHSVLGVDPNPAKVGLMQNGQAPVLEPELPEKIAAAVRAGTLKAVADPAAALQWQVAFVCVGTPSAASGQLDAEALRTVCLQLGRQITARTDYVVIAIRSTVMPNVVRDVVVPSLTEGAGVAPGSKYGLVVTPEFLREGSAVKDFRQPPFTVIGESDARAGDVVAELFAHLEAPILRMGMGEAVMVKYACNAYHAVKVAFANEIGLLCARDGIDGTAVMTAFCKDTKLNCSSAYLIPGFAFGGYCLPKDVRALNYRAKQVDVETPLLNGVLPSNRAYLERCVDVILGTEKRRIGVFGMSFKPGTDDLRESPMITLIEALIGKGCQVRVYDSQVRLAHLTGTNREFIEHKIPHIASLMQPTIEAVLADSEVLVVGNRNPEFEGLPALKRPDQILIEFSKPTLALGRPVRRVG